MLLDSPDTLKTFFAIPQTRIDADLASADREFLKLCEQNQAFLALDRELRTPAKEARNYHSEMLRAHVLCKRAIVLEEEAIYCVSHAAQEIAEEAAMSAYEKGRLAELQREMSKIERRAGLKAGEAWRVGRGPKEYNILSAESEGIIDRIIETIFVHVLERYHFDSMLSMYQDDRM